MIIYCVLAAAALLCAGAAALSLTRHLSARESLLTRFRQGVPVQQSLAAGLPAWLRTLARELAPLGMRLGGYSQEATARQLLYAGSPGALTTEEFLGLRAGAAAVVSALCGLGTAVGLFRPLLVPVLVPVAWFAPAWWLHTQAQERQGAVAAGLPDFLDTVSVGLLAGLSLDASIRLVAANTSGPLGEEMARFAGEVGLGVPRTDALYHLQQRCPGPEVQTLVQSLLQGYELGVPVATVLAQQARHLRSMRAERARELAARASPKIILVTTFIITPGVMLLIVGLLLLNLFDNAGGLGFGRLF